MSGSMEDKSQSPSEEENFMISEVQSNMPKDMMNNPLEEDPHSKQLAQILRQMISKTVQEFRAKCRAQMAEDVTVSPITVPQKKGKKLKNRVVGEQFVFFSLPENCNIASIKDINKVQAKLGDWRIQSRQRDTRMCDTYYYHFSTKQSFRSITEVVNYILPDNYPKEPSRKKRSKGQEVMTSKTVLRQKRSLEAFQPEELGTRDGKENLEEENNSKKAKQSLLQVKNTEEMLLKLYTNLLNLYSGENKRNYEKEMQINIITKTAEDTITEVKEGDGKLGKCLQEAGSLEVKGSNVPEESGTRDRKENIELENISNEIMQSLPEVQTGIEHEYETLGEVIEKMKSIDVDSIDLGQEEETHHNPDFEDIPVDWAAHDSLIRNYFDECDLVNHIPISESFSDLVVFLNQHRILSNMNILM